MPSSVGLEAMNSTKPMIIWENVQRRRRSTRNNKGVAKVGNFASPKRVGDFSGSDSDKVSEVAPGPTTSCRSKIVPIKKMRRILQSPSPRRRTPLSRQVSASPQTRSSPFFEDQEHLLYSGGHSAGQRFSKRKLRGIDETAKVGLGDDFCGCYQTIHEYHDAVDFSGIQLLADTASMYFDDNGNKKELAQDSLMPKDSDPTGPATLPKVCLKVNELENYSSDRTAHGGNTDCYPVLSNSAAASQTLFVNSEDVTGPNVDRQHWDLNTPMDAWEEPHDESIDCNTTNGANIEEIQLTTESQDIACSVRPSFEKHLVEPPSNPYFNATEKNASEEKLKSTDTGLKVPIEECSSDVKESEKTPASDKTQDITAQDTSTSETSESPFHVQCKDNRDSLTISELPGELIAHTGIQDDENYLSGSTITDSRGHLGVSAKHEDNRRLAIGSTSVTENSSKSFSEGAHSAGPIASDGKFGPPNLTVSQNIHSNMVDGNSLPGFNQEAYDSPYEDGELRGSFMYSWEDIEVENESVDYESDGRNGDGDYPGTDMAGGGLEGSMRSIAEKGSYVGSGPTVEEQSKKLLIDENDDFMKKSQLTGRRSRFDVKPTQGDEYTPNLARGNLHSQMEGWSSMDATEGKDSSSIQQFRSRRFSSYPRHERNISPPDKYRLVNHGEREGEMDGGRPFTSWGPRRQFNNNNYASSYQGLKNRIQTRPRSHTRDHSADRNRGWDFHHDPRQAIIYPPKTFCDRPFTRPHGKGNYRGRGFYSQHAGMRRDFRDNWDSGLIPYGDDDDLFLSPARMPHYASTRERSFSPTVSYRNPHMPLLRPRRESRSRSRTRSPRATWDSRRRYDRSRSPDLKMDRMRMMPPFPKPGYGDGVFVPPHHDNFGESYIRRRRSPVRRGRFDVDERFIPAMRRRRFESNYDTVRNVGGRHQHSKRVGDVEEGEFRNNTNDAPKALGDGKDNRAVEV